MRPGRAAGPRAGAAQAWWLCTALLAAAAVTGCAAQDAYSNYVIASAYDNSLPPPALLPGTPVAGKRFSVTVQIWNLGDAPGRRTDLHVWADRTEDPQCGSGQVGDQVVKVPAIPPHGVASVTVRGLKASATPGPHTLLVWIGGECGAPGYEQDFDVAYQSYTVAAADGPDLVVSKAVISEVGAQTIYVGPGSGGGRTVSVTVTVKNQGTKPGSAGLVRAWPVPSFLPPAVCQPAGAAAAAVDARTLFSPAVLRPGQEQTFTVSGLPVPDSWRFVHVTADAGCAVAESDESNNDATLVVEGDDSGLPFFAVTSVAWDPPQPQAGTTATLLATVSNLGPGDGGAVGIVQANTNDRDPSPGVACDPSDPTWTASSAPQGPLKAYTSVVVRIPGVQMPAAPGMYEVAVRVDAACVTKGRNDDEMHDVSYHSYVVYK